MNPGQAGTVRIAPVSPRIGAVGCFSTKLRRLAFEFKSVCGGAYGGAYSGAYRERRLGRHSVKGLGWISGLPRRRSMDLTHL